MSVRDTDIRRLNELTGANIEFRDFGSSVDTRGGEWSLLSAVGRSAESGSAPPDETAQPVFPAAQHAADRSGFASLDSPGEAVQGRLSPETFTAMPSEPLPVLPEPSRARPNFASLFRKPAASPAPDTQHTDLVALLKAISRCR